MSNILHSLLEEDSSYKTIHRLNLLSVINQCKHFYKIGHDPSYDLLQSVDKDKSSRFVNENISKHVTGTKIVGLLTSPYKLNIESPSCVRKINNLLSKYAQSVTPTTKIKVNKNLTVNTNSKKIIEVMLLNNHNIYTGDKIITDFLNPTKKLYLITYSDHAGYTLIDYTLPEQVVAEPVVDSPVESTEAPSSWYDGLSEDVTSHKGFEGVKGKIKDVDGLTMSYLNLQSRMGSAEAGGLKAPTAESSPEELSEFYNAAGRPETAGDYTFDGLPEGRDEHRIGIDRNVFRKRPRFLNSYEWSH